MLKHLLISLILFLAPQLTCDEIQTSRFILPSDLQAKTVAGCKPVRPQEYMWASQFARPQDVVLDAACGVSEPFKWFLGKTCKETWAIDIDPRIADFDKLVKATKEALGEKAGRLVVQDTVRWKNTHLVEGSICTLPSYMPKFDRIFCIGTFHLLNLEEQKAALTEFSKSLAADGLILLTMKCPEIQPEDFLALASSLNLVPAGEVELSPSNSTLFRCVLKRSPTK